MHECTIAYKEGRGGGSRMRIMGLWSLPAEGLMNNDNKKSKMMINGVVTNV